jgi:hypothetical protein
LDLNNRVLVDKRIERRHHPMPSTDGFNSDDPLPLLLAELKQQDIDIGKAWDRAILTASILGATATAIFVGILWVGNPATTLFADKSALQPSTGSAPTIQSTTDAQASTAAQALPPTAEDATTRDETAAATQPADQKQTENSEPSEALLALDNDAQALVVPVQPVQDALGQVAQNAPALVTANAQAPLRPMQDRHVRPAYRARAEIRPVQNPRKKVRQQPDMAGDFVDGRCGLRDEPPCPPRTRPALLKFDAHRSVAAPARASPAAGLP